MPFKARAGATSCYSETFITKPNVSYCPCT